MTVASLAVSTSSPSELTADALVVGVSSSEAGPVLRSNLPELAALADSLRALGVTGAEDELRRMPGFGSIASVALVGLGSEEPDANALRRAAGSAARQLTGAAKVAFALPVDGEDTIGAVLEGAAIGSYSFSQYRSQSPDASKLPPSEFVVLAEAEVSSAVIDRARTIAEAMHTVRDLVNTPPVDLYPATFADRVLELAEGLPVEVTVLAEEELREGGYGGLLGVGLGSTRGPRMVKVSYSPEGAARHLALVGKGITFDSGGLSLKPPASMVGMKYDMTGAASVLAVVLGAAKLGLDVRVTAWLCLAENLPSGSAVRPNDVLRIRGGKTVEVLNTDAEGRLVLADGLVAASEESPDAIIDVATLTGAARVALGDRYVGVMGRGDVLTATLEAATAVGEQFWHMPLPSELRPLLNSDVADIANVKIGHTAAGMLIAGVFLRDFVGDSSEGTPIPWAHLDIAGPANNDGSGYGFTGKGPTGVTVRALLALAESYAGA